MIASAETDRTEARSALDEDARPDDERDLAVDVLEHGDPVIVLDDAYRVVLVNENQVRLSGRAREDSLGRGIWELFPDAADPRSRFREVFERVMRDRVPEAFEERYAPLDMWASVSVYPTRQGGLAVFVRDVTERRRAEDALREQEAFASKVLSSSLNGIYVVDLDAEEAVFVNARYTQLTGYGLEDLRAYRGGLVDRLFHPDDRATMRAHLARLAAARDGEVLDVEYRFRARDGRFIWCTARETPFARAPDGTVRQLIGTFLDVTEHRRAQQAARDSEARYAALFETMTEGFAVFEVLGDAQDRNADCRFLEVNPAFERLTGLPRAAVLGRPLSEIAPREVDRWVQAYEEVARTGTAVHLEHRSTVVDRDYEVYAFCPRPRHLAVLFVDITDRKRVEEELRDSNRRTSHFLGVLSHELRNPLAPIRNAIYLLERAPPDGAQADRARLILRRQTEHLARLVDDLLDVTRISRGKIELRRVRLDARGVVVRTCDDHRSLFDEAGVELRTELPTTPAWVDADPTRLSQIIANLLANAAKFTPPGGSVVVAVRATPGRVELEVRDTGVGIAPDDLERMFEPFAQADRSLARTRGGLGLGLALVKGLAELHGGTAAARSAGVGHGAAFVVTLTAAPPPAASPGDRAG